MLSTKNASYSAFITAYPEYEKTSAIDKIRAKDFAPFDAQGEVYLDYTGGGRYGLSQVREHIRLLESNNFGNPHSLHLPSQRSTKLVEEARSVILGFFHASPEEYCVIFTPNASGALRLVGESYPFQPGGSLLYTADNHNSVGGIREYARTKGAAVAIVPSRAPTLELNKAVLKKQLSSRSASPRLFAYPAQSNFSGVQHDLGYIHTAHRSGWDVLLDAAAFVPTNRLDLRQYKPDFVTLSFYKMFGWPTGVGALIARNDTLTKLHRPWYAGGTIWAVSVRADWHIMTPGYEAFEDGTVNYLNIPAVSIGLRYLQKIGVDTIHTRTMCLTGWVIKQLQALTHSNGTPVCEIYGPDTTQQRGPTIACNFLTSDGKIIDERTVDKLAVERGIALRTGCFCNPGSGEVAFNLKLDRLKTAYAGGKPQDFTHYLQVLGLQSAGAIRFSFGEFSNFLDAQAIVSFASTFCNATPSTTGLPARKHC